MSNVTSLTLMTSPIEDKKNILKLNKFLRSIKSFKFVDLEDYIPGRGLNNCLYAVGINHLDFNAFMDVFKSINWEWPNEVILIRTHEGGNSIIYEWNQIDKEFYC